MQLNISGTDLGEVPIHGNNSEVTLNQEPHNFLEFNPFTRVISLIQRLSVDNGSTEMQPLIIQCQTASRTVCCPLSYNVRLLLAGPTVAQLEVFFSSDYL